MQMQKKNMEIRGQWIVGATRKESIREGGGIVGVELGADRTSAATKADEVHDVGSVVSSTLSLGAYCNDCKTPWQRKSLLQGPLSADDGFGVRSLEVSITGGLHDRDNCVVMILIRGLQPESAGLDHARKSCMSLRTFFSLSHREVACNGVVKVEPRLIHVIGPDCMLCVQRAHVQRLVRATRACVMVAAVVVGAEVYCFAAESAASIDKLLDLLDGHGGEFANWMTKLQGSLGGGY